MKRLLTLALSLLMLVTSVAFVGCGGQDRTEKDEAGKVQLNVGYNTAGFGDAWFKWVCSEFEKIYPNVQVKALDRTAAAQNGDVGVSGLTDDIVFYGFSNPNDFYASMIDITDIYDWNAYDENYNYVPGLGKDAKIGATVTLNDRLSDAQRASLNHNTTNLNAPHEYHGVPLYDSVYGYWYDVDLFKGDNPDGVVFYATNAQAARRLGIYGVDCKSGTADDTLGPDALANTYDDGLPATFEDLKRFCNYVKKQSQFSEEIFVNTGKHEWMQYQLAWGIAASYEGLDNIAVHSTFDGTYTSALNGKTITVTPQTGYKLWEIETIDGVEMMPYKAGERAAVYFVDWIAKNSYFDPGNVTGADHVGSQYNFLDSAHEGDRNFFLGEGSHWIFEARDKFALDASSDAKWGMDSREFAPFPIPRFYGSSEIPDQIHDNTVAYSKAGGTGITLLKGADRQDDDTGEDVLPYAKEFMLFSQSNPVMKNMASELRLVPTVEIKISDAEKEEWNPTVKNTLDFLSKETNPKVQAVAGFGDSLCKQLGKSPLYYDAIEASYSSAMYMGACLNPNSTTRSYYLFNEFCVAAYDPATPDITADQYLAGMNNWVRKWNMDKDGWELAIR